MAPKAKSTLLCAMIGVMAGPMGCGGAAPPPVAAPVQVHGSPVAVARPATVDAEASDEATTPRWIADESMGLAMSRKAGKPVLLSFDAAWCAACRELEQSTFSDPEVKTALRGFVTIRVDATDDEAPETMRLMTKYRVQGLPTVLVLDATSREVARITEFVQPKVLLGLLAKAAPR